MKVTSGSFRVWQWDPMLLICQICSLQGILYCCLSILIAILQSITGGPTTLDHLFQYHEIHVRDVEGQMVIFAFLLNAVIGGFILWIIVQRTKLCLDFSCTYHVLHLAACWYFNGQFPATYSWWLLNIVCASITCVAGEFLCLKTELKAIPLSMSAKVDL